MGRDGVRESLVSSWNIPPACYQQTGGSLFQSGKEGFYDNDSNCHSCCDCLANPHDNHGCYPQKAEVTQRIGEPGNRFLNTFTIHLGYSITYTPFFLRDRK